MVNARFAKPLDVDLLRTLARDHHTLVTVEEGALMGGFGSGVVEALVDREIQFQRVLRLGVPDRFITFGSRSLLLRECGLDAEGIVVSVEAAIAGRKREPEPAPGFLPLGH